MNEARAMSVIHPQSHDRLVALGEALLCMGQAFLTPRSPDHARAVATALPEDLAALDRELQVIGPERLEALQAALTHAGQAEGGLLRVYSRLFLTPPFPAPLNAGIHLDGGLMGRTTMELERIYQSHGLARDTEFRDLPDHLALQLQFLGFLHATLAEGRSEDSRPAETGKALIERFLLSWMPAWLEQLREATTELPNAEAYHQLGRVTHELLLADLAFLADLVPVREGRADTATQTHAHPSGAHVPDTGTAGTPPPVHAVGGRDGPSGSGSEEPVDCRHCGRNFALDSALAFMVERLSEKGLATDHLLICPDCRGEQMGLATTTVDLPDTVRKRTGQ